MELNSKEQFAERFIRYASICTQSAEGTADTPSTDSQRVLAGLLYQELLEMGADDVYYDEKHCYVYASLKGNIPPQEEFLPLVPPPKVGGVRENICPILGFVAHMDTSDAVSASEIHPRLIPAYTGEDIELHQDPDIILSRRQFPELDDRIGETLIVTDGTSVLGGDDKAGITQIMELFSFYLSHPEYPHGTLRLMFTPDEEVGNGILNMDPSRFSVDFGFTVDGSSVGELEYENFNAASARLRIRGLSTHPGDAKGKMRNAVLVGIRLASMLPADQIPEKTAGYEGFFHLCSFEGTTDSAKLEILIRDHDRVQFERKKLLLSEIVRQLNTEYGEDCISLEMKDSYYNMAEKVLPHLHLINTAAEAMKAAGVKMLQQPIRGGTDGCMLSFKGIPCPNLGTGAHQYHSRYEYVSADEMRKGTEILIRIVDQYARYELIQTTE